MNTFLSKYGKTLFVLILLSSMVSLIAIPASASSGDADIIWSEAAGSPSSFVWTPQTFEGFYYNYLTGSGTEEISIEIGKGSREIRADALEYRTTAEHVPFAYKDWGGYSMIAWLGKPYAAAIYEYSSKNKSHTASFAEDDMEFLDDGILPEILIDSAETISLREGDKLKLGENYTIIADEINSNKDKVTLTLKKGSKELDSQDVSSDEDYIYEAESGNLRDMPVLVIHIGNITSSRVEFSGIFQISENPETVKTGKSGSGILSIDSVSEKEIIMTNVEKISLKAGKRINLTDNYEIVVFDTENLAFRLQAFNGSRFVYELSAENAAVRSDSLKSFFKELSSDEIYTMAGAVYDESSSAIWTGLNFPGFYYNAGPVRIDDYSNITIASSVNPEKMEIKEIDSGVIPKGNLTYSTEAFTMPFSHSGWGSYQKIFIGGIPFLAGYAAYDGTNHSSIAQSAKFVSEDINLVKEGCVYKIVADISGAGTYKTGSAINLEGGYVISIGNITGNGNSAKAEIKLLKNNSLVKADALGNDEDFVYCVKVGNLTVPVIVAHVSSVSGGSPTASGEIPGIVTIDGYFQVSNQCYEVTPGSTIDSMKVSYISKNGVQFENAKKISLENKTIPLIGNIAFFSAGKDETRIFPYVSESLSDYDMLILTELSALDILNAVSISNNVPETRETENLFTQIISEEEIPENGMKIILPKNVALNDPITITVTDKTGNPIEGALLKCEETELGTTDSNGKFPLVASSFGSYNITVSKEPYVDGKAVLIISNSADIGAIATIGSDSDSEPDTTNSTESTAPGNENPNSLRSKIMSLFGKSETESSGTSQTGTGTTEIGINETDMSGGTSQTSDASASGNDSGTVFNEKWAGIYGAASVIIISVVTLILAGLYVLSKNGY